MNVNSVMIVGRLVRDPEMKSLPSGASVTTFSLATSSSYKKGDEKIEEVEYHSIVVYGKQADNCARYLTKGQIAAIDGRLKTRSWEKDGAKQYRTEVVADRVQFGPSEGGDQKAKPARKESSGPGDYSQNKKSSHSVLPEYPDEDINPDDIPF